jgi:hypothetical protein
MHLAAQQLGPRSPSVGCFVARPDVGDCSVRVFGRVHVLLSTGVEHDEDGEQGQNVVFFSNLLDARKRGDYLAEVFDVQLYVGCKFDPETPSGGVLKSSLSRVPLGPKDAEQLEYVASDPSCVGCYSTERPSGDDGGWSQVLSSLGSCLLENNESVRLTARKEDVIVCLGGGADAPWAPVSRALRTAGGTRARWVAAS